MKLSKPTPKNYIIALIFFFTLLLAVLLNNLAIFQTLELKSLDWRFSFRGAEPANELPVVILAIDDQSDESTPARWPWPRSYFAHVIENLEEAGVAAIGIDVIFDQPDRFGPQQDDSLKQILMQYDNVALTGKLLRSQARIEYQTLIPPYDLFIGDHTLWGLAALESDIDGFYRKNPVVQQYNDSLYASLAAQVIKIYEGGRNSDYRLAMDDDYFYLGKHQIPRYDWLGMLVNFRGPAGAFRYYSFDNVLDDADFDLGEDFDMDVFDDPGDSALGIPPGLKYSGDLKGKIVLIGSTMHELHDNFPTPFLEYRDAQGKNVKAEMPGVEIHANALSTILNDEYYSSFSLSGQIIWAIVLGLLVLAITRISKTALTASLTLSLLILYFIVMFTAFTHYNYVLPFNLPVMIIVFGYVGYTLYQYIITQQEKRMLRGAFAYYVPETVIQDLINNPQKLSLGGEERIISVLFSDVAGFTTISENLEPRDLVALLNEYLTEMTDIVLANKGIIDKYEGDAIMAEFGVPVYYEEHARMACFTALEMQHKLRQMRKKWEKEGRPQIRARVGINTGEVIVGNMGSRDVFDYTVMGDHVNLGARLESANKFYGTEIMISEFTYRQVKDDFYTRPLDLIRVKGKQKPIEVFELIATKDTKFTDTFLKELDSYSRGVQAYRQQKWLQAIDYFEYCLKSNPEDRLARIYKERCVDFRLNPPPEDWDGVTTMKEK